MEVYCSRHSAGSQDVNTKLHFQMIQNNEEPFQKYPPAKNQVKYNTRNKNRIPTYNLVCVNYVFQSKHTIFTSLSPQELQSCNGKFLMHERIKHLRAGWWGCLFDLGWEPRFVCLFVFQKSYPDQQHRSQMWFASHNILRGKFCLTDSKTVKEDSAG